VGFLKKLFESLLAIKDLSELKLTLAILTRAAGSGDCPCAVTYGELQSSTGLSPASLAKAVREMVARGYVTRHLVARNQPARYQVLWHRLGIPDVPGAYPRKPEEPIKNSRIAFSERLESYFTNTGFLDLLPMAADIASELGYGEPEMIEAVCMVFDKQRSYPPTSNRSGWFTTVYKEKLIERHALIANWRDRQK